MDSQNIGLLTKHIDLLMKAKNVDALLNELLDRNVLSEYIAIQLKMIPNEEIRLKTLFEELKSRGPAAFEHLLSALVFTGNEEICDKLNENKNPSSVYSKIKVINAVTPLDVEDGSSMKIYRMRSSPRGYVLIINNHDFFEPIKYSDEDTRHGSYRDVANLYTLFSQLGYKVRMHYNLTKKEIHDKVSSFAAMPEHASVDSTVVVVMSHGERYNDTFRSYDNLPVHCDKDIVAYFTNHKSEHLHGKPKIFIFQICRGNQHDHGKSVEKNAPSTTQDIVKTSTSDATGSSTVIKTSLSTLVEPGLSTVDVTGLSSTVVEPGLSTSLSTVDVTGLSTTVDRTSSDAFRWATGNSTTSSDGRLFDLPNYDEPVDQPQSTGRQRQPTVTETREARVNNIFKIYSTTFDYASTRDCVKGSYFVDNMCQIFSAHAHRLELRDLLHETAKIVTSIYHLRYGIMTPSITCSADCGKLYFNPGIYDGTIVQNHQVSDRNDGDSSGRNSSYNGDRIENSNRNYGNSGERNSSNNGDRIYESNVEKNVVFENSSQNDNIFENINMNFEFCDRGNRAINRNKTSSSFDTIITSSVDSRSLAKYFENRADVDEKDSKKCAIIKSSPENSERSVEKQAGSQINEQNVVAVEKLADNEQNVVAVEKLADNEPNVVAVEKLADNEQNVVAVEKQADNERNVVAVEKLADNEQNVVAVEKLADNEQNVVAVEKLADNEQNVVAVEKLADNEQNVVAVEKLADNEQNVVAVEKLADNEQNVVAVEKQADNERNVVAVEKQADSQIIEQNVVAVEKQTDNEQNVLDEVDNNNFENCKSLINDCSESEKSCTEDINSQKGCVANFEHDVQIAANEISVLVMNEDVKQSCETNSTFYVPCDDSSEDQFLVKNLAETDNKVEGCVKTKNWAGRKYFKKSEKNVVKNDKETSCFDKSKCELS